MNDNLYKNAAENNLLIKIHPEGIFYAITDEDEQILLQQMINMPSNKFKDIDFLEHFFDQPELRVLSENVSIVFEDGNYQLIPNELFKVEDLKTLYELEFGKKENVQLRYDLLPKWGANLVYDTDGFLMDFFDKKYPDAEIKHHISKFLIKKIGRNSNAAFVNLRKEAVDIVVIDEHNLQLANSFQTKTNEDICYFILNVYEQLELDAETFPLHLFSENSINDKLTALLKQYVLNIV